MYTDAMEMANLDDGDPLKVYLREVGCREKVLATWNEEFQ
jgi:hypothetical protein